MSDTIADDPAAEFLQQEGEELRELGIESEEGFTLVNNNDGPTPPADTEDGFMGEPHTEPPPFDADEPSTDPMDPFANEFEQPPADNGFQEPATGGFDEFEDSPGGMTDPYEVDTSAGMDPFHEEFQVAATEAENETPQHPPHPIHQIIPSVEPDSVAQWRTEKTLELQKREAEEGEAISEWSVRAKKEVEDWYARYNEQQAKARSENRTTEAQFIEEMNDRTPGNEWEKAARFCDFTPKMSKNSAKDVSRMRTIMIQLKQTPLVR